MASSTYTADTEVDTVATGPPKQSIGQKFESFATFIWNNETNQFLGRTAKSWALIGLFYLVYYTCLVGFWIAMLSVFYQTVDWDYPKLQGGDSLLHNNPGMGYRPMPDVQTNLIRFVKGKPSTYKPYTDHIEAFLKFYEKEGQVGESFADCGGVDGFRDKEVWDKVCPFNLDTAMGDGNPCIKQDDFGFDDGQPCILLKLNKVYGWLPEKFTDNSSSLSGDEDEDRLIVPPQVRDRNYGNGVIVNCYGENQADKENMGNIAYYPPWGFHYKFFPFLNQQGYRQPLVFAHFENITNGVVVMITCRVYAPNIYFDRMDLDASVHFEVMVD